MANVLALDCSDRACSVAVRSGEAIVEIYLDEQRLHAKRLLGLIQDSLQQSGLQKEDLDAVAWARGPGSFTGLRIAAACVQGLCFGLKIPAIGISSLLALAMRARELNTASQQRVWVGLDAKMGEVYTASFMMNFQKADYALLEEERLIPSENLELPEGFNTYLGSALNLLGTEEKDGVYGAQTQIHAADLLGLPEQYMQSCLTEDASSIEPVYLRRANAWKKMGTA